MDSTLSVRQAQILSHIRDHIKRKGYPPSVRDIQTGCSISSTSVVDYNLKRLAEKGYIEREEHISRGIRLIGTAAIDPGFRTVGLDGYIERGRTEDAPRGITLDLPSAMVDSRVRTYALKIGADPMPESMATAGDLLIVQDDAEPQSGDTVLARVESRRETVIRRYYPEGPTVRLEALNPLYESLTVLNSDLSVTGKVVGMLRTY